MEVRPLLAQDWPAVKTIYELGIATGIATFETAAPSWEKWTNNHLPYGRLVAVANSQVIGWAALTAVSSRCIYQGVAEVSVYVHPDFRGKGIGQFLLKQLIFESEANGIWTLQATIFRENTASIKLHGRLAFRLIGYREKIGQLNGVWKDNVVMERRSKVVGIN
ncbi:MAG: N-acetyltransferase family protein [Bacteroidota bacterium]